MAFAIFIVFFFNNQLHALCTFLMLDFKVIGWMTDAYSIQYNHKILI